MRLLLDGELRALEPLHEFRAVHSLPADFSVAYFAPKAYEGLGRIEEGGAALSALRTDLLAAIPARILQAALLDAVDDLVRRFDALLRAANDQIGLREPEIEFAVGGFADVLRDWAYALIQARAMKAEPPAFIAHYGAWLMQTIRIAQTAQPYTHQGQTWQVQVISHAYGRMGLRITMPSQVCYVQDAALACPAEGFMQRLLASSAEKIAAALH